MFIDSNRIQLTDKILTTNLDDKNLSNYLMLRVAAKKKVFCNIDFKYTYFDTCYFRKCVFRECNFTGCRFVNCNFNGANFCGCAFDYSFFEKTIISSDVLSECCPSFDNVKMRFARSLRVNFQGLGDAEAANKAIQVELSATESMLRKAWKSNESYYRNKYRGIIRFYSLLRYAKFKALDHIWGNGESLLKLLRFTALILLVISTGDVITKSDPFDIKSYISAILVSPHIFLGTLTPEEYSRTYLTVIHILRFIVLGFIMAIIIKRLNRR